MNGLSRCNMNYCYCCCLRPTEVALTGTGPGPGPTEGDTVGNVSLYLCTSCGCGGCVVYLEG